MPGDIFKDRRRYDRRAEQRGPTAGCRRRGERRRMQGRYNPAPWWLQINYAEELSPRDVTAELRRQLQRESNSQGETPEGRHSHPPAGARSPSPSVRPVHPPSAPETSRRH